MSALIKDYLKAIFALAATGVVVAAIMLIIIAISKLDPFLLLNG